MFPLDIPDWLADTFSVAVPWLGSLRSRVRWGLGFLVLVVAVALSVRQAHIAARLTLGCALYAVLLSQMPALALQLLGSALASIVMSQHGLSRWLQMPLSLLAGVCAYLAGVYVGGALYTVVAWIVPAVTCR